MIIKSSDEWQTPQWLFDELNKEFRFTCDACATRENTKCDAYMPDALNDASWRDEGNVFMNPPYSNPKPFVEAAWRNRIGRKVVLLLKCDPSTKWWGVFWDYTTNWPKMNTQIRYIPKRLKFNDGKCAAPFPSVIVIMGPL